MPPCEKIECLRLGLRNLYPPNLETMIYKRSLIAIVLTMMAQFTFVFLLTIVFMHYDLALRKMETNLQKAIQDAKQEILTNCAFEDGNPFTLY